MDELTEQLYQALQGVISCPRRRTCCREHEEKAIAAMADFLNRWRSEETESHVNCVDCE